MRFLQILFDKKDERAVSVERAAGNLAFTILWILNLAVLVLFGLAAGLSWRMDNFSLGGLIIIPSSLLISIAAKYCYCWIKDLNRYRILLKLSASVILSTVLALTIVLVLTEILR